MNHRILEDWLFSYLDPQDDGLTPEQISALEEHLKSCKNCRDLTASWRAVDNMIHKRSMVSPHPGFSSRWLARQQLEQQKLHRRQSLATLVFLSGGAAILLGSLFMMASPWLGKPEVFLWSWIYRLVSLVTLVDPWRAGLALILRSAPESLSPVWLILAVGFLCELAVLWLVSYRVLTNPRRVPQ